MASHHSSQGFGKVWRQMRDLLPRHNTSPYARVEKNDPNRNTIYKKLKANREFSTFTRLVEASSFKNILDNPNMCVTFLAVPDKVFDKLNDSDLNHLNKLEVDELISYHILKKCWRVSELEGNTVLLQTYNQKENMYVSGGLNGPRFGRRYRTTAIKNSFEYESTILDGDHQFCNGIVHIVSAPVIPEYSVLQNIRFGSYAV